MRKQIDDFITQKLPHFALKNGFRIARPNYLVTSLWLQTTSQSSSVSSLLPSLPKETYKTPNSDSSLDIFFYVLKVGVHPILSEILRALREG